MISLVHDDDSTHAVRVWFSSALSSKLPQHSHRGCELNLVMAGEISCNVDARDLKASAGQLLVLAPGVSHRLVQSSSDAALWVFEFTAEQAPVDELNWLNDVQVFQTDTEWKSKLASCAKRLWMRPGMQQVRKLDAQLLELLSHPKSGSTLSAPTKSAHLAVEKARAICETELEGEITAEDLARRAGVSPGRLAHLFQDQVGISPVQYKNFVRLQNFIEICGRSTPNFTRAALEAGFGSYPQFHRVFHQVCGAPPGEHLKWLSACCPPSADSCPPSDPV